MGEGSIGESHNRIPPLLRREKPRRHRAEPIDASLAIPRGTKNGTARETLDIGEYLKRVSTSHPTTRPLSTPEDNHPRNNSHLMRNRMPLLRFRGLASFHP